MRKYITKRIIGFAAVLIGVSIRYYDYDINPLQMYMFLSTGEETMQTNTVMSMTYEKRYRNLLCKDVSFSQQDEYRFIETNELITEPVFYLFLWLSLLVSHPRASDSQNQPLRQ